MEGDTIKVKILEGGKTAKEINPLGEEPKRFTNYGQGCVATTVEWDLWQSSQNKLRTFEIIEVYVYTGDGCHDILSIEECELEPLESYAQIISENKIRIL